MAYTYRNFKTKKELKEAVKNHQTNPTKYTEVHCYNPGLGGALENHTGTVYLEGPHYPQPPRWYAEGRMVNGILVSVK